MIEGKIMSGKNVVSKLNFEQYFAGRKSVLVICDLSAEICGAKRKIKKAFSKEVKVTFAKIKASDYAEVAAVDSCLQSFKECNADLIVCVGDQVACNLGKAVQYISSTGAGCFADFCKLHFNEDGTVCKDNAQVVEQSQLIYVATASGDHIGAFTGEFEVYDNKQNVFYRFDKSIAIPNVVMVDDSLLDKLSIIAGLGIELGVLTMSLLSLANCDEENKIVARTAITMLSGDTKPSLCDLCIAEMTAGQSFLNIKNNLLKEVVLGVQRKTGILFYQVLVLMFKKSYAQLVADLDYEDIKLLGKPYAIAEDCENIEDWRKAFCNVITEKLDKYFEDKDIPNCLNETGLNSDDIEQIFAELESSFGSSTLLTKLKDLTYASY